MDLKNANIIITGGSSGIGKVTAQQCIQKGAKVLITGRDEVKLKQVAEQIGAIPLASDISQLQEIPKMAEEAIGLLGGDVDVLMTDWALHKHNSDTLKPLKKINYLKSMVDAQTTNINHQSI